MNAKTIALVIAFSGLAMIAETSDFRNIFPISASSKSVFSNIVDAPNHSVHAVWFQDGPSSRFGERGGLPLA